MLDADGDAAGRDALIAAVLAGATPAMSAR